jgi:hypothetical protein
VNKKILAICTTVTGLLLPLSSYAADLTITCSSDTLCSKVPANSTFFSITNAVPGQTITRTIDIVNDRAKTCGMQLGTSKVSATPTDFDEFLFTVIRSDGADVYGRGDGGEGAADVKTLDALFNETAGIALGNIRGGQTRSYDWTITLNPAAGNDYQDARAAFDFDLAFSCEEPQVADDNGGDEEGTVNNVAGGSGDGDNLAGNNINVAGVIDVADPAIAAPRAGKVLGEMINNWLTRLPSTGTRWDGAIYGILILVLILTVMRTGNVIRTTKSK